MASLSEEDKVEKLKQIGMECTDFNPWISFKYIVIPQNIGQKFKRGTASGLY